MNRRLAALVGGLGLMIVQLFAGCTAIGYGVGYVVDTAGSDKVEYPPAKAVTHLEPGDEIEILLRDGASRQGIYAGRVMPTDEVLLRGVEQRTPERCLENAPLWPGDTIIIQFHAAEAVHGIYLNADEERLYYRAFDARRVLSARYWDIRSITFCDGGVLSADFASQYLERNFEAVFDVQLRSGAQEDDYSTLVIEQVRFDLPTYKYRQILAGAGLATDATALAILLGFEPAGDDTEE